jgi:hypothetical protein
MGYPARGVQAGASVSHPDHRIQGAKLIGHRLRAGRIIDPRAIDDEFVLMPARREREGDGIGLRTFPPGLPHRLRLPVVEGAGDGDFVSIFVGEGEGSLDFPGLGGTRFDRRRRCLGCGFFGRRSFPCRHVSGDFHSSKQA